MRLTVQLRRTAVAGMAITGFLLPALGCVAPDRILSGGERKALLEERWQDILQFDAHSATGERAVVVAMLRAHALLAVNRNDEALAVFDNQRQGMRPRDWREWTGDFAAANAGSRVAQYLAADGLARARDLKGAIQAYSNALAAKQDFWLAVDGLAVARLTAGGEDAATADSALSELEGCVDRARARCRLADAYASAGTYYLRNKRPDLARPLFGEALRLNADFSLAKIGLACVLLPSEVPQERERAVRELVALRSHPILGPYAAKNLEEAVDLGVFDGQARQLAALAGVPGTSLSERMRARDGMIVLDATLGTMKQVVKVLDGVDFKAGRLEFNAGQVLRDAGRGMYDLGIQQVKALETRMNNPGGIVLAAGTANYSSSRSPSNLCFGLLF